jgi:P2 family phage contractile tail tube protein
MGLPSKLKNFNLFLDGVGHIGEIAEVTLPKLTTQVEDWRGGGMLGPIAADLGLEKLEAEFTAGGLIAAALRQFGAATHDAAQVRFAGAYQSDGTGRVQAVEAIMRGRYTEIDLGNAKTGSDTEHKYKLAASYYRLVVDGVAWIEVDLLAPSFIVFGQDRYAEIRAAIAG